jgi:preprotein translocase subunit SecG
MFKNPLNADENITELADELQKEGSDRKTVAKLYTKIIAKGAATGLLITTGIAAIAVVVVGIAVAMTNEEEDSEETEEENSEN